MSVAVNGHTHALSSSDRMIDRFDVVPVSPADMDRLQRVIDGRFVSPD